MPFTSSFATNFETLRRRKKLSINQVAKVTGIARPSIIRYMRPTHAANPTLEHLQRIKLAFGCTWAQLLD